MTRSLHLSSLLICPDSEWRQKHWRRLAIEARGPQIFDFENMEVPEENILGEKGKGLKICLSVLDYGRTTFGATCTGVAKYL